MNLKSLKEGGFWGKGDKRYKNLLIGCFVKYIDFIIDFYKLNIFNKI